MVFLAIWSALIGYTLIYMGISGFSGKPVSLWDALGISNAPAAKAPNSAKSSTVAPPGTAFPSGPGDRNTATGNVNPTVPTPGVRNSPGINPGQ